MVLDAKALTWAAQNNIDTAKLKAARVPVYGKWYFPEIPASVPLVNLETGEQEIFPERMVAGEVIYVPATDLQRAGLAPEGFVVAGMPSSRESVSTALARTSAPEPLLAMTRPPGLEAQRDLALGDGQQAVSTDDPTVLEGIHMPSPSIAPFVLGVGFCIALFGVISNPIIFVAGLLWMLAGAIAWIRVGLLEARAAQGDAGHDGEGVVPTP